MTLAKVWLRIFVTGYVAVFVMWLVSLTSLPPYGDLTRIGHLAEEDFGWTKPAPTVDPAYLKAAPVDQADILVIGDSFSMTLYWQASLAKAGYRVATTYWGQYGTVMCKDFDQWIQRAGFKGKLIIFESVERLLDERTVSGQTCEKVIKPFASQLEPFVKPAELPGPDALPNWSARFDTGPVAYYNSWRAKNSTGRTAVQQEHLGPAAAGRLQVFLPPRVQQAAGLRRRRGQRPADHGHPGPDQELCGAAPGHPAAVDGDPQQDHRLSSDPTSRRTSCTASARRSSGPTSTAFAREKGHQMQDFYFSNDTHLSMHGQLALGEYMLGVVREVLPVPQTKAP